MLLVKDLVERYRSGYLIDKKNNKHSIYKALQAISLSSAFLHVREGYNYDDKRLIGLDFLFKQYKWVQLKKVIKKINRDNFNKKGDWAKEVKMHYPTQSEPYLNLLSRVITKDEYIIDKCLSILTKEEQDLIKKEGSDTKNFSDFKIPYSIGVVVIGGREEN